MVLAGGCARSTGIARALAEVLGLGPEGLLVSQEPGAGPAREPEEVPAGLRAVYLGIDVGSVSTDLVLLDASGDVLSAVYLPTRGRPAEAVESGLSVLA